ncbi:alpha/beta hydrolase [Vibrio lentus]|nr:alpha/beta hydrolase [Vibrio lentus]
MLIEKWLEIDGDQLYCLSSDIKESQETLVLIHGLGESHLCFADALDWLPNYNLIMFDLCGYGYSPASNISHSTETQANRILKALDLLSIHDCFLLGHSWGGDTSTLICEYDTRGIVRGFINAEGGLHEESIILSQIIADTYSELSTDEFTNWVKGEGFSNVSRWLGDTERVLSIFRQLEDVSQRFLGKPPVKSTGNMRLKISVAWLAGDKSSKTYPYLKYIFGVLTA